jgi:4-diphosphocytidyl-2-C-methyl-D-erythritol kinase
VVQVATALADTLSRDGEAPAKIREGVSAFLAKRIPAGAGLAGGSSDAAAALIGLNRIWRPDWSMQRLSDFAAQFGSDLSFFFHGPSSICTGRGEIVRPIDRPNIPWAALILPGIEMPTPAVYRRFDEMRLGREEHLRDQPDWTEWVKMPARKLAPLLVNDLEAPAFVLRPELGELRTTLEQKLGQIVRMSGSGSSLFTLCDNAEHAQTLAQLAHDSVNVDAIAVPIAPDVAT